MSDHTQHDDLRDVPFVIPGKPRDHGGHWAPDGISIHQGTRSVCQECATWELSNGTPATAESYAQAPRDDRGTVVNRGAW